MEEEEETKKLEIEFLYLNLTTCTRCQTADKVLFEALQDALKELSIRRTTVKKIQIKTLDDIIRYNFQSSPTIRVNGEDIEKIIHGRLDIKESYCGDCCGPGVICTELESWYQGNCRVFTYKGKTYEHPPKEMIKKAIMKKIRKEG